MLTRDLYRSKERTRHPLKPLFSHFFLPTPETIARLDIRLRRAALYPAELWVLTCYRPAYCQSGLDMASRFETQVIASPSPEIAGPMTIFTHTLTATRSWVLGLAWFVCACAAVEPATTNHTPETSGPAIWRVADDDTEVFLFGTIHLLPKTLAWQTEKLENTLLTSDIIYLEAIPEDVTLDDQRLYGQLAKAEPGKLLSDLLSEEDYASLEIAADELGLPFAKLNGQRAWQVSILFGRMALERLDFDARYGSEAWIQDLIDNKDIEKRALEGSMVVPVGLASLPDETQLEFLMQSVDEIPDLKEEFSKLIAVWASGDAESLDASTMQNMREMLPDVYEILIVERNKDWRDTILHLLNTERGRIFIAVGAGHLSGPDSLVRLLEEKELTVTRF